jgi:hypothetical protein
MEVKKDSGGVSLVLAALIAGAIIGTFILGPIFWGPKIHRTEQALCEKKMQEQGMMKVRQVGDLRRGRFIDPNVSPENQEAMERFFEQDDYEAGRALSFAEAYKNPLYIDLLREKITGNKEEAARITRIIQELKAKPSIQD